MTTIDQIKQNCRKIIELAEKATPVIYYLGCEANSNFIDASRAFTPQAARALLGAIQMLENIADSKCEFYTKVVALDAQAQLELICREWEESK